VSPEALQVAQEVLEAQILPAVADAARHGGGDAPGAAMMRSFPLGFSTGDAQADLAATVLRALYIRDLRDLQTRIDQAIVQVQARAAGAAAGAATAAASAAAAADAAAVCSAAGGCYVVRMALCVLSAAGCTCLQELTANPVTDASLGKVGR
jgi:hypothetical protein